MKILIFSRFFNNPLIGGAEVATFQVFKRLSKDHEIHLVTSLSKGEKKFEQMSGLHIHRVTSPSPCPYIVKSAFFANKLHKKIKFDKVYVLMANHAAFAAKLFLICNPKTSSVLNLQSGDSDTYIKKHVPFFVWPLYKRIYRWFDKITAISSFLKKRAIRFGAKPQRITIIPNGVDTVIFKPYNAKKEQKTIITTSRLAYKNNVGNLIKAMDYLKGYKLLIVGNGELGNELKQLAKGKSVKFLGHLSYEKIPKLMNSCGVFVRVPYSEGFGNSFIEAMSCKLPVVASKVGGIPDFIIDGENGVFAKPHNPKDIAEKIKLLENKSLYKKLSENAYKTSKEYDWNSIAKRVEKVLYER